MKPREVARAVETNMANRIAIPTSAALTIDLPIRLEQPVEDQVEGFGAAIRNVAGRP